MNQLTNFYRNKAEDLQRQVNLLEQKINEGVVTDTWKKAADSAVAKELKTEFGTAPNIKATGKAIAHPIETAQKIGGGVKSVITDPWATAAKAAELGTKVVKAVPTFGAAYIMGGGAGDVAETGAHALGIENPMAVNTIKSAADFGAFNATAATLGALATGVGAGGAMAAGGAAAASGALAGAAAVPIIVGGVIVGYKAADAALESKAGKAATNAATKAWVGAEGAAPKGNKEEQTTAISAKAEADRIAAAAERGGAEAEKQRVMRGGEVSRKVDEISLVPDFVYSIGDAAKATQEGIGRASMGQNPFKGPAVPEGTEEEIKERQRKAAERRQSSTR